MYSKLESYFPLLESIKTQLQTPSERTQLGTAKNQSFCSSVLITRAGRPEQQALRLFISQRFNSDKHNDYTSSTCQENWYLFCMNSCGGLFKRLMYRALHRFPRVWRGRGGCSIYTAPNLLLLYGLLRILGVWVPGSEGKDFCVLHCSMA